MNLLSLLQNPHIAGGSPVQGSMSDNACSQQLRFPEGTIIAMQKSLVVLIIGLAAGQAAGQRSKACGFASLLMFEQALSECFCFYSAP